MSNRTVNLKDVAAKAGVSITTVSHVINKTRFVKPETTAAVESAIKELNYVHNLAAKTLRSKKSGIIGVMITGFGNPYFLEILQGIEHILSEKGYQMILGNIGSSMGAQEKQLDICSKTSADGSGRTGCQYRIQRISTVLSTSGLVRTEPGRLVGTVKRGNQGTDQQD